MSLKEMNARASVPSGFRYRARLSGSGGGVAGFAAAFEDFFGDDEKNERIPPLEAGAGRSGGGGAIALNI